ASPQAAPLRIVAGATAVPPFAVLDPETGVWSGPAIELFRQAATEAGAEVSFTEVRRGGLNDEVVEGLVDASALPLFPTRELRRTAHVSPPVASGQLAVVVRRQHVLGDFVDLLSSIFGRSQLRIYTIVVGFALVFALIVWLLERRRNPQFRGHRGGGIGSSMWWSMSTLSTVGYCDKVPQTTSGRAAAGVWMMLSLVLTSLFTAAVTSSLTVSAQTRRVNSLGDLPLARVGLVDGSYASRYFIERGIPFVSYPTSAAALAALSAGNIDASADASLLVEAHVRQADTHGELEVLPDRFAPGEYHFVLNSELPADFLARFDDCVARLVASGDARFGPPPAPTATSSAKSTVKSAATPSKTP
ncbi:MAG: ion channel, partial [Planctomycetota bacterium]